LNGPRSCYLLENMLKIRATCLLREEQDMADETSQELRKFSRERFHDIWEVAKTGDTDLLDEEDRLVAEIMMEHQDEFFSQFEMADLTHDHEFDAESETNPFLHITIHQIVENQLRNRDPIEVYQFYNAMRSRKALRHDIMHLIGAILTPLMFGTLREQRPFDLDRYTALLKKYKNRKPDKIWKALAMEADQSLS
jgi:hypothetical protein